MASNSDNRQRILDGIEALYPADAGNEKAAFIGQVLLRYALENTLYNWRDLPLEVLERYLAICEDYERQLEKKESIEYLPVYLKR